MKVIWMFNAQPVKIPQFKSSWHAHKHFLNVHTMNVDYAKFQKKFDSRTISRELIP